MEGAAARLNMLPDAATAGHSAAEPTERMDVAVQAASLPDAPDARLTTPPPASAHPDLVIPPLNFSMVNKGVYRSGYPNPKNFTFLRRLGLRSILCAAPAASVPARARAPCSCVRGGLRRYLGSDKYRAENQQFLRTCRLQFFHCPIEGNKVRARARARACAASSRLPAHSLASGALPGHSRGHHVRCAENSDGWVACAACCCPRSRVRVVAPDSRNHPILIHCYKGQVRPSPTLAPPLCVRVCQCVTRVLRRAPQYQTGCVVGCLRKLQQWSLTSIFDEYRRFARSTIRVLDQQFIEQFPVHALLDGAAQLASEAPAPAGAAAAGGRRDSVTGGGDGGGGGGGGGGSAAEVQGGKGREPALS